MKSFKFYNNISWKQVWQAICGFLLIALIILGIVGVISLLAVIPLVVVAIIIILLIKNNSGRGMAW